MKITTSVQSSFPRTITTSALVLIVLAVAAPTAVAQLTFSITDLGALGASAAYGINNNGQVVGNLSSGDAFIYSGGTMTNLGTLLGVFGTAANAINNSGEVVGYFNPSWPYSGQHAFLYSGGILSDLGTLGGDTSEAYGINDSGQVVGYAKTIGSGGYDPQPHAFPRYPRPNGRFASV